MESEMLSIAPIGSERFHIPVNPIEIREIQPVSPKPVLRRTEPLEPTQTATDQRNQKDFDTMERVYLLSVETRRALIDLGSNQTRGSLYPTY
jgi:hypothetical protein